MQGLHPFPKANLEHRENWRVTNEVLNEMYFSGYFLPGALTPIGVGAGAGVVGGGRVGTLLLPDLVTTNGRFVLRLPEQAVRHYLRLSFRATGTAIGNVFLIRLAAWAYREASNYNTGSTVIGDATLTVNGPAAVDDRIVGETLFTTLIGPGYEEITGFIERDGFGDTNNGQFHLVRLDWELLPV